MGVCINYDDTVTLAFTTPDGYGTEHVVEQEEVKAMVNIGTGYLHNSNQDAVTSDADVLIDPTDDFVADNYFRLEEAMVSITLFNTPLEDSWYKVIHVGVYRDLLCNEIDNVQLLLKKSTGVPADVS